MCIRLAIIFVFRMRRLRQRGRCLSTGELCGAE